MLSYFKGYFRNPELSSHVNVIVTDWSVLSSVIDYLAAAQHAVSAGKAAGQILGDLLVNKLGADPKKIHAIGHSLGAHFVGHLGRELASFTKKGKIGRVTGKRGGRGDVLTGKT